MWCFRVGWGYFVYLHSPERSLWQLSKEQGLVVVFRAEWDPIWVKWAHLGNLYEKWATVRKVGHRMIEFSLSKFGERKFNQIWREKIQSYYKTFTTHWSGGRVQVWVEVWAPACHLTPEGYSRRQSKFLTAKSILKLLRTRSCQCTAWAGWTHDGQASTNTGRFLVCSSRCWQRQAHSRKKCYHFCNTDSVESQKGFNAL